jgi:hypothetical protein
MAKFSRFTPARDAFLFGWAVLGEDFLGPTVSAINPKGYAAASDAAKYASTASDA